MLLSPVLMKTLRGPESLPLLMRTDITNRRPHIHFKTEIRQSPTRLHLFRHAFYDLIPQLICTPLLKVFELQQQNSNRRLKFTLLLVH